MTSLSGKSAEINDDPLPLAELLTDLSVLLAMQYRRAPLPVPPGLVRWFAGRPQAEVVDELGSVVRRCILLGDEALVLRELRHQRFTGDFAPAHRAKAAAMGRRSELDDEACRQQGEEKEELPSPAAVEPVYRLWTAPLLRIESSTSHRRKV